MNLILSLILVFTPEALAFPQQTTPNPNQSVSIEDLRNASTIAVIDNRSLEFSAYPWRDFMPGAWGPDGSPLMVVLRVSTADKGPFPLGIRVDRAWVLFGEQTWEVSALRGPISAKDSKQDSWIQCSDKPVCEITLRDGPKWGPGVFVDVVIRLTDSEGHYHLVKAPKQLIQRTD